MSKQDSQFFNIFSLVIGGLVAVALVLLALARVVGRNTQAEHVHADASYVAEVNERTAPFVKIAVAGQDNSALAIVESNAGAAAAPAAELPTDGEGVFKSACQACHGEGIGGAPKAGDKALWAPRIAQGKETLYKHAIAGFTGEAGMMPAKGGRADLSDDLVKLGVDYMVSLSQ